MITAIALVTFFMSLFLILLTLPLSCKILHHLSKTWYLLTSYLLKWYSSPALQPRCGSPPVLIPTTPPRPLPCWWDSLLRAFAEGRAMSHVSGVSRCSPGPSYLEKAQSISGWPELPSFTGRCILQKTQISRIVAGRRKRPSSPQGAIPVMARAHCPALAGTPGKGLAPSRLTSGLCFRSHIVHRLMRAPQSVLICTAIGRNPS